MVRRDYKQGDVLHERFVLERSLQSNGPVQLWIAHDNGLGASVLLRIYVNPQEDTVEAVRRVARISRGARHPQVARIHDVHERDHLVLVSLDAHDGQTLHATLTSRAAMHHRQMVEIIRPVIEALLELHEGAGEHGQFDEHHLLLDDDDQLTVLPADGTRPGRSDMRLLSRVMALMLTGGNIPPDGGDLNNLADRLHEGRTIPALLNQLINDMGERESRLRPANMRDVLHRLDQLDEILAPPVPTEEAPPRPVRSVSIQASPEPPPRRSGRRSVGKTLAWIAAPLILLGVVVGTMMLLEQRHAPPEEVVSQPPEIDITPVDPPTPQDPKSPAEEPGADRAAVLAAKQAAESALDACFGVRAELDLIGAERWEHPAYLTAAVSAEKADAHFLAEEYAEAELGYRTVGEQFTKVLAATDDVFARLLREGQDALDAPDAAVAAARFEAALLIEPGNEVARIGLTRTQTLDRLHELLATAQDHENEGRLAFAFTDYASAAAIDPYSKTAAESTERVRARIADEEFRAMMAAGLDAFHSEEFDTARRHLVDAGRMRPGSKEVTDALAMVDEARLRQEVRRLQAEAVTHEQHEQWQAARRSYRQVLAIDPAIEFAQMGVTRSEEMIRLGEYTRHFLANPTLLLKEASRNQAVELIAELELLGQRGPELDAAYRDLANQVRRATLPRRVVLKSDELTEVDVYRVRRYGTFRTREIELLPGRYTVVGHRRGFKDVRLTLEVKLTDEIVTLEVICKEAI